MAQVHVIGVDPAMRGFRLQGARPVGSAAFPGAVSARANPLRTLPENRRGISINNLKKLIK